MYESPQSAGFEQAQATDLNHFKYSEIVGRVHPEEVIDDRSLKEKIFVPVLFDKLLDTYGEELLDVGFSEDDILQFEEALKTYDDDSVKSILSIPKELRPKLYGKYLQKYENGEISIPEIIAEIAQLTKRFGFTLGYHVSQRDIQPSQDGSWDIHPTELDDRDDMKMAYYSLDFDNIYRKKPASFIYLVRAETGQNTSHKRDQQNNWSRAPFLSIVEKYNLLQIDQEVEQIFKELKKENEGS